MKSILMSIKPRFVAKILNRVKTIEVRKKFPVDYVGWVYIYCTKEDNLCCIRKISRDRYICGKDFDIRDFPNLSSGYDGKGKVVARFWCYSVKPTYHFYEEELCALSCLTDDELFKYLGHGDGYGIHITKLEIFDEPKELWEFETLQKHYVDVINAEPSLQNERLTKAPQSWCYVEESL